MKGVQGPKLKEFKILNYVTCHIRIFWGVISLIEKVNVYGASYITEIHCAAMKKIAFKLILVD